MMNEEINFNNPEQLEEIQFEEPQKPVSAEYEFEMQEMAGVETSNDFQGVRDSLAQKQIDADREMDLQIAKFGLEQGTISPRLAEEIVKYPYRLNPEYSLERAAAEHQVTLGLSENPDMADIAAVDKDGVTEEMAKKAAMMEKFFADMDQWISDSQGFIGDTADFIKQSFVPGHLQVLRSSSAYSKTATGDSPSLTTYGMAKDMRETMNKNYLEMSSQNFEQFLNSIKNEIVTQDPNRFMARDFFDTLRYGGSTLVDTASWADLIPVVGAVKKAFSKGWNKAAARNISRLIIRNSDKGVEKLDTMLETAVKPVIQDHPQTTFKSIASNDIADEIVEMAKKEYNWEGLSKEEADVLIGNLKDETQMMFGLSKDEPLDIVIDTDIDGRTFATYTVGNSADSGMSFTQASNMAERFQKAGVDVQVIQRDGTGSVLQFKQEVDYRDVNLAISKANDPLQWIPLQDTYIGRKLQAPIASLSKVFAGSSNVSKAAAGKDIWAERRYGKLLAQFAELKKPYNSLSKESRARVDNVAIRGNKDSRWYPDEYLIGEGLNDEEITAYHALRKAEDLEYIMECIHSQRNLHGKGYRLYSEKYIGKQVDKKLDTVLKARIIDEDGNLVRAADLKDSDKLIQLAEGFNHTDATHVLIRGEVIDSEIPLQHLPYRAGGRREYSYGTFYVRVLGDVKDADGTVVSKRIRTIAGASSQKEAKAITNDINKLIGLIKLSKGDRHVMAELLAQADLRHFKVHTIEQLDELIDKGVLSDNGLAKFMLDGKDFGIPDALISDNWDAEIMNLNKRFRNHRGNVLEDALGNQISFYSTDRMFTRAVEKAAAIGARSDLALWYQKALKTYEEVLANGKELQNLNPVTALREATLMPYEKLDTRARKTLYRAAENFLAHAQGILNTRTKGERAVQRAIDNLAYQLVKHDSQVLKSAGKALSEFNPTALAQRVVFNKALGWFNPGQLLKQAEGLFTAISMEPVMAMKVLTSLPTAMAAMLSNDPKMIKRLAKSLGESEDTIQAMFKFMKTGGTKESSGLLTGAEHLQKSVLNKAGKAGNAADWLMKNQYAFMRWGNAINYYTCDMIAFLKHKNSSYKNIAEYSNLLFGNMTRASNNALQRGLTAPLTQWLTYPMRTAEIMFGLKKGFSMKQRLRYWAIMMGLYGPSGILGDTVGEWIYGWYKTKNPYVKSALSDGLMGLSSEVMDIDLRSGPRLGNLIEKFWDIVTVGEGEVNAKSLAAAFGGYDYLKEQSQSVFDFAIRVPFTDLEFTDWCYQTVKKPNAATTFKSVAAVGLALKTNKLLNHKGTVVNNPTALQIAGRLLGYQPNEAYHQRMIDVMSMSKTEKVRELVDELDDIITRIKKYDLLTDVSNYSQDDKFKMLLNEFDEQVKLRATAIKELEMKEGLTMFYEALSKKITGTEKDLTEEARKKALKHLPKGIQALTLDIMKRD